jgi:response regulator RpfG family c-di-GMP phosphodiesterase
VKLVCIEGSAKHSAWEITGTRLVIGSDAHCDVNFDDPGLSRNHAEIIHEGGHLVFVDRGSPNGSFINGRRVTRKALVSGDRITIGDTTIQVAGKDPKQPLQWHENDPFVTSAIPVDHFRSQLKRLVPEPGTTNRRSPGRDSEEHLKIVKLTKNLETLYRAGDAINSIQNLDEMLDLVAETLLAVYQDVERLCILLKARQGALRFEPKIIKTRPDVPAEPLRLSRSILGKSVREEVCLLAGDARSDERFVGSQSIMNMRIRSVMCAPLISKGSVLGVVYLDNRKAPDRFDEDDLALLSALANQSAVAIENSLLYEEVQRGYHEAILALMNTVDAKDSYTSGHSQRTSRYAHGIAREMGVSEEECKKVRIGAELHDIGKIGVGDFILGKQDTLSAVEFNTIQAHVLAGENIVKPIRYLRFALPMIRHHHEHYDGTGYPDRLKGDQIPLGARIIGAADAFDAMTTQRPYNKPLSTREALRKCIALKGKQFDPEVIDALARFVDKAVKHGLPEGAHSGQDKFQEIRLNG